MATRNSATKRWPRRGEWSRLYTATTKVWAVVSVPARNSEKASAVIVSKSGVHCPFEVLGFSMISNTVRTFEWEDEDRFLRSKMPSRQNWPRIQ